MRATIHKGSFKRVHSGKNCPWRFLIKFAIAVLSKSTHSHQVCNISNERVHQLFLALFKDPPPKHTLAYTLTPSHYSSLSLAPLPWFSLLRGPRCHAFLPCLLLFSFQSFPFFSRWSSGQLFHFILVSVQPNTEGIILQSEWVFLCLDWKAKVAF